MRTTVMATPELSEAWELSLRLLHYLRLPDRARLARAMKRTEFGAVICYVGLSWGMRMFRMSEEICMCTFRNSRYCLGEGQGRIG